MILYTALHNRLLATILVVFCFFLVATLVAWKVTDQVILQEANNRFYTNVAQIKNGAQERINLYVLAIEGLRDSVELLGKIDANQWSSYVKRLGLVEKYPGISSIGYLAKEDVSGQTAFVVRYLEPMAGREKALGINFMAEEKRRKALERARDTGKPAATGKIILATTNAPGFMLIVPIYNAQTDQNTPLEQKRATISGFVFAVFRGTELFKATYGSTDAYPNLDFEIYDGTGFSQDSLLYDHDPEKRIGDQPDKSQLTTKETISIDSQKFVIVAATKQSLGLDQSQIILPKVVLVSGLLICFLFLAFFLYQYRLHLANH